MPISYGLGIHALETDEHLQNLKDANCQDALYCRGAGEFRRYPGKSDFGAAAPRRATLSQRIWQAAPVSVRTQHRSRRQLSIQMSGQLRIAVVPATETVKVARPTDAARSPNPQLFACQIDRFTFRSVQSVDTNSRTELNIAERSRRATSAFSRLVLTNTVSVCG